jgi:hypothetical protein
MKIGERKWPVRTSWVNGKIPMWRSIDESGLVWIRVRCGLIPVWIDTSLYQSKVCNGMTQEWSWARCGLIPVWSRARCGLIPVWSRARCELILVSSRARCGIIPMWSRARYGLIPVRSRARVLRINTSVEWSKVWINACLFNWHVYPPKLDFCRRTRGNLHNTV